MTALTPEMKDVLKRRMLFMPCTSKAHLHLWIQEYLGLDMPDTIVDPESTSTPMAMLWEVYDNALNNKSDDFSQILAYASRDSFKTLAAAILEVLAVLHLQRDVAHMAALKVQAIKSQSYVAKFFNRPYLRDFVIAESNSRREIARYYDAATGENLTQKEYKELDVTARSRYVEISNYITIIIATLAGANGEHTNLLVVDEIDVIRDPAAYQEAKMIPAPKGDQPPITLYTSTRKFSFGLVQKEIDRANESGLHIRHWNLIDVTQRCPPSRHQPELPMKDVYVSRKDLLTVLPDDYNLFHEDKQSHYEADKAYSGCLTDCRIFAMCRGRLATEQRATPKSQKAKSLLKPISSTQNLFKSVDVEVAKAQLLCWKPSTEGLIYPSFDRDIHMLTAAEMHELITGDAVPENYTKHQLVAMLKARGTKFAAGMDFGYTHMFSVTLGAIDGNRCFVLDVLSQAELEVEQQIELCNATIRHYSPKVTADSENPQAIVSFKKKGYSIKPVLKGPGSVIGGIEVVRAMLRPAVGSPRLYFLKDDPGCELLAKRMGGYHWKLDAAGDPSKEPDDDDDDELDSMRYLMMSNFAKRGSLVAGKEDQHKANTVEAPMPIPPHLQKFDVREMIGGPEESTQLGAKGKKGNFFYDL